MHFFLQLLWIAEALEQPAPACFSIGRLKSSISTVSAHPSQIPMAYQPMSHLSYCTYELNMLIFSWYPTETTPSRSPKWPRRWVSSWSPTSRARRSRTKDFGPCSVGRKKSRSTPHLIWSKSSPFWPRPISNTQYFLNQNIHTLMWET